jgi:hypothetical protein
MRRGSGCCSRRRGIADRVRFLGPCADVPAVLAALDVYALTSIYEGVPFSLLEAMAMGLPVVTTPVAAVGELIAGNGVVVGTSDPYQTYLALRDLFRRPALRAALGRRSRALAREHGVERMLGRYEQVLEEALAEARGDPPFSRRVLLLDTGAPAGGTAPAPDDRFRRLRRAGVDAYLVRAHPPSAPTPAGHAGTELGWPRWPPGRRYRVPADVGANATAALEEALAWIDPDLALAASPEALAVLRRRLPDAEVLAWADGERVLASAPGTRLPPA